MIGQSILSKITGSAVAIIVCLIALLPETVHGMEVSYVGSIQDGLSAPTSLETSTDQIAVLQPYSRQIIVFTPSGTITRRIDIAGDGNGLARLSGSVYLYCDRGRKQVVAVNIIDGRQWMFTNSVNDPVDIIVIDGECTILDSGSCRIVITDSQGHMVRQIDLTSEPAHPIKAPASMAFDSGRDVFHVFDQLTSRIHVYDQTGDHLGNYCSFGSKAGTVTRGGGVVCDTDGYVYVVDRFQGRVSIFDPDWLFVLDVDTGILAGEPMAVPTGIAVDPEGTIYVSSTENNRIYMFFLDKTAIPHGEIAAAPLFPAPSGMVSGNAVKLAARLAAVTENGQNLSADFRITSADAPEVVVAETVGLSADELGQDDQGRWVGTATWHPENDLTPGTDYLWQARARTNERVGSWFEPILFSTYPTAIRFHLEANYPNPFNPSTTIAFTVPAAREVMLNVYDLKGNRVWSKVFYDLEAGRHTVTWEGRNSAGNPVASGVYFYQLRAKNYEQSRKMVLLK